jgi:hypothetical protein
LINCALMTDYSSSIPKVVNSSAMDINPHILDNDLSTDTLLGHDMVPEGLPASSKEPAEQHVHHIKGVSGWPSGLLGSLLIEVWGCIVSNGKI